jgi:hypothetical protein
MAVLHDLSTFRVYLQSVIMSSESLVSCCTSRISSLLSFILNIRCRPLETSPTSNRSSTPSFMLPPASAADSDRIQSCLSLRVTESKSSAARICERQRCTRELRLGYHGSGVDIDLVCFCGGQVFVLVVWPSDFEDVGEAIDEGIGGRRNGGDELCRAHGRWGRLALARRHSAWRKHRWSSTRTS